MSLKEVPFGTVTYFPLFSYFSGNGSNSVLPRRSQSARSVGQGNGGKATIDQHGDAP